MTSAEIRQSFLEFFHKNGHSVVPSSSLMPDSPGLLFTNAGMNQFVPIFLGERKADVSGWAGARPASDTRAADTQKCIRAGGKHNDLEDVGWDTYHHTLFEMFGNWSFGDYFKMESLEWGWELLTKVWGIPPKRLFASVYSPDKSKGDPSEFDQEAHDIWAAIFRREGLDPAVHIVNGNKKDNFWMMGDTGPCGPCSEIHFNLLEQDDEQAGRALVNSSSPRCIEIWNHVFIQFNANADGTFAPLAAKHVDTGMGFERVAGIHATTKGFKDFSADPSNYNADLFTPIFAKVAELSGKTYKGTVPTKREGVSEQESIDVAFRVLADHARCVSCAIADGILPGNDGRNYVIRRILRRGILYGKKLGLQTGFFEALVEPVVATLGSTFPELKDRQDIIRRVIRGEEESFGRTLDRGVALFDDRVSLAIQSLADETQRYKVVAIVNENERANPRNREVHQDTFQMAGTIKFVVQESNGRAFEESFLKRPVVRGADAFELYDTYGFPLDMTQLLATERGLTVDTAGFEVEMEQQRARARAAQKKEVVVAATERDEAVHHSPTEFLGYTQLEADARLLEAIPTENGTWLVFDRTPFYAEMGGQTGDAGTVNFGKGAIRITDCVKDKSGRFLHQISADCASTHAAEFAPGATGHLAVDAPRRRAINRHHSAAHLVHWALRKVLGTHVRQAGTSKTPDRLRFDFAHFEQVKPEQLIEIERLVNERVIDNATVRTFETEYDKRPEGTLAFFGDKYGKIVRVVDMGGFSLELCGGTHVSTAGEIGVVKIVAEMAIAAGTRRVEAVAGSAALDLIASREAALNAVNSRLSAGAADIAKKVDLLIAHKNELEKKLKSFEQKAASGVADELAAAAVERDGLKFVSAVVDTESAETLRALGSQVLSKIGEGVVQLGAVIGDKATVVALCSPAAIKAGHQAGKIVSALCAALGGKGGGRAEYAMGGGREVAKLKEVLKQS
ncbi:MAG TPA: alanine--tRNA ligase [Opitutaceae bacterium]|nr:alanine--tRNA ligase [Opitutaceae bacterium]